ncbi:hypothetical protein BCR43DRAFT_492173 [Syncephalastrum racemosum]|uniref:Uncharacterized protein n=1 Tax=Syncephalastrum racemosum TaxID=13706 RepID=A0A1X2HD95_SYNRA|nr:hypothetical protein BCR43DRAFT_492173 [Syncephalastrum racemosum]
MAYNVKTLFLIVAILVLSFSSLLRHSRHAPYSFPPIFLVFHIAFHLIHTTAHYLQAPMIERRCVVYGTHAYWTGWCLGVCVFSERLAFFDVPMALFWLLLFERRNAWGIIHWEFVGRLEEDSLRTLAYRTWCLLGCGSAWGLFYIALASYLDGFPLSYLLRPTAVAKLLLVSAFAGTSMICFWSFWTFQYRGVLWKREYRKGVVVWYSEGIARAGDVE